MTKTASEQMVGGICPEGPAGMTRLTELTGLTGLTGSSTMKSHSTSYSQPKHPTARPNLITPHNLINPYTVQVLASRSISDIDSLDKFDFSSDSLHNLHLHSQTHPHPSKQLYQNTEPPYQSSSEFNTQQKNPADNWKYLQQQQQRERQQHRQQQRQQQRQQLQQQLLHHHHQNHPSSSQQLHHHHQNHPFSPHQFQPHRNNSQLISAVDKSLPPLPITPNSSTFSSPKSDLDYSSSNGGDSQVKSSDHRANLGHKSQSDLNHLNQLIDNLYNNFARSISSIAEAKDLTRPSDYRPDAAQPPGHFSPDIDPIAHPPLTLAHPRYQQTSLPSSQASSSYTNILHSPTTSASSQHHLPFSVMSQPTSPPLSINTDSFHNNDSSAKPTSSMNINAIAPSYFLPATPPNQSRSILSPSIAPINKFSSSPSVSPPSVSSPSLSSGPFAVASSPSSSPDFKPLRINKSRVTPIPGRALHSAQPSLPQIPLKSPDRQGLSPSSRMSSGTGDVSSNESLNHSLTHSLGHPTTANTNNYADDSIDNVVQSFISNELAALDAFGEVSDAPPLFVSDDITPSRAGIVTTAANPSTQRSASLPPVSNSTITPLENPSSVAIPLGPPGKHLTHTVNESASSWNMSPTSSAISIPLPASPHSPRSAHSLSNSSQSSIPLQNNPKSKSVGSKLKNFGRRIASAGNPGWRSTSNSEVKQGQENHSTSSEHKKDLLAQNESSNKLPPSPLAGSEVWPNNAYETSIGQKRVSIIRTPIINMRFGSEKPATS